MNTATNTATQVFPDPHAAALASKIAAGGVTDADVYAFIADGGDVDAKGEYGVNLLHWAVLNKSVASLDALLNVGANPAAGDDRGVTVLHLAALANDGQYLAALLAHQVNPDTPNTLTGASPLVAAIMGGREEQFSALLAAGADVDRADRLGNTPLHQAAKVNDLPRVERLLRALANPHLVNKQGLTFRDYLTSIDPSLLAPGEAAARATIERLITPA